MTLQVTYSNYEMIVFNWSLDVSQIQRTFCEKLNFEKFILGRSCKWIVFLLLKSNTTYFQTEI